MVVLEDGGMMATNPNQYLQPDYLPHPTNLDSKKSPLALLAQTCSQIGADTLSSKPLLPQLDKKKTVNSVNSDTVSRSSPTKPDKPRSSPESKHLAFKPYETNVITKKPEETRPSSKASSDSSDEKKSGKSTPGRKSTSPSAENEKSGVSNDQKSSPSSSSGTSPIIRSGLEIFGHTKDHLGAFKNITGLPGFNPLAGMCYPPGMEQANPAFRPPYAGAPLSAHHAAMLAAAASFPSVTNNPYLHGYARTKITAGESLIPLQCKEPFCTGCQLSTSNHLLMNNGTCPAGCTQCEHQKYNLTMAMALSQQSVTGLPYQMPRSSVCSWVVGDTYCSKRFTSPDELLQHLRTHTDLSTTGSSAPINSINPVLRSPYPTAPLSPLSASRFHPYSKALPGSLGSSPYGAFNPTLGHFYSPYAVYGQRLGAAAVHQ